MSDDMMEKLLREKDAKGLVYFYFGITLTAGQARIVRAIAFQEARKISIRCYTQYGKTMGVGLGIALHILLWSGNHYRLVASQDSKTAILRNYVAEFVAGCKVLSDQLTTGVVGIQKITTEISRKRLTFNDGAELKVLSAQGDAQRLMGEGGNIIVVDETGEIPRDVFIGRIKRMYGAYTKSGNYMIVEIGNPWDPNSHFADHWDDPRSPEEGGWLKIFIPAEQGVEEGRITREYLAEMKSELTPIEYRVLYDAEFPEETSDQLIKRAWFEKALTKRMKLAVKEIKAGADIAEMGLDKTVLVQGINDGRNHQPESVHSWEKMDTMPTVGKITKFVPNKNTKINVDATGVGSGVCSRLKELEYRAFAYKGGENPETPRDKKRFRNKLAMWYWAVHDAFEEERIDLHILREKYPAELRKIQLQLFSIRYEIMSGGQIRILKPKDYKKAISAEETIKSPDFADAFMLFIAKSTRRGISAF